MIECVTLMFYIFLMLANIYEVQKTSRINNKQSTKVTYVEATISIKEGLEFW